MTDLEIDADIARILARHHNRRQRGAYEATTLGKPLHRPARPRRRQLKDIARPECSPRTGHHNHPISARDLPSELDTLQHTVAFALAGLTIRQGAA